MLYSPGQDRLERLEPDPKPAWHDDLALLLSTSGSTGAAKWVRLSHANLAANANSIVEYLGLTEADCAPMSLPFQYSYGMSILNSHLAAGATLALSEGSVIDEGSGDSSSRRSARASPEFLTASNLWSRQTSRRTSWHPYAT
ncbi:AMP-binding protein [Seohaeicola zhoushanensis]